MAERGWNPFVKAFVYFARSLKPSTIKGPRTDHVGTDHLGNKYFETPPDPSKGKRKPVRYFKPPHEDDWDVPLPPEWNAWLRMQREDAPSEEEMAFKLKRISNLEAKRLPIPEQKPSFPNDSKFPKFPEYEEVPGSKYK